MYSQIGNQAKAKMDIFCFERKLVFGNFDVMKIIVL